MRRVALNVKDFVNHIDYAVKLIGIDHVGNFFGLRRGRWNRRVEQRGEAFKIPVTLELVRHRLQRRADRETLERQSAAGVGGSGEGREKSSSKVKLNGGIAGPKSECDSIINSNFVMHIRALSFVLLLGAPGALETTPALDREFEQTVRPFVAKYCVGCHSGQTPAAQFDLKAYASMDMVTRDYPRWAQVLERLSANEMPPKPMLKRQPKPISARK